MKKKEKRIISNLDYSVTLLGTVLVALSSIFVYRLASVYFGPDGFAEYALMRRALAVAIPVVCVGIAVALPKKIAEYEVQVKHVEIYFLAAISLVLPIIFIAILLINLFPNAFSRLIFGNEKYYILMPSLSCNIFGLAITALSYSYLRGKLFVRMASLLVIFVSALIPVFSIYLSRGTIIDYFWIVGGLSSFSGCAVIFLNVRIVKIEIRKMLEMMVELFTFGIRRVPGDFALSALLALPSIITAHVSGLHEAGMMAFSVSLLTLVATAMSPFSIILLPHSAKLIQANEISSLKRQVIKIVWVSVFFSIALTLIGLFFVKLGVKFWLGNAYLKNAYIAQVTLLGVMPYSLYICLRSVIDAAFVRAKNAQNIIFSLAVFLGIFIIGKCTIGGESQSNLSLVSFLFSIYFLGILTCLTTWLYFHSDYA